MRVRPYGSVAQTVERSPEKGGVGGSIPSGATCSPPCQVRSLLGGVRISVETMTRRQTSRHILNLVNVERRALGIEPLRYSSMRTHTANVVARKLARTHTFEHGPRVAGDQKLSYYGEALALGQHSPMLAVEAWMASPPHRALLLNRRFTKAGFGAHKWERGRLVWVAHFSG